MDLKLSYFCQKNDLKLSSFSEKRNPLPDLQPPAPGGFNSRPSKQPPSLQIPPTRPGATGGHTAALPPKKKIVPPKRGLCPEEINRLWASGAQIKVQISVFLWTDTRFCDVFRMKTFFFFFFFGEHVFLAGKTA